ncbi:MAG: DUF2779 domain-containing protein [Saccharofermentanales bacterium]
MYISKSKYISYSQCPKRLWLSVYRPELADEMDQSRFIAGNEVGALARNLFPGGTLVDFCLDETKPDKHMVEVTKSLMAGGCRVLYEAAFAVDDLLVICDILVRNGRTYDVYEVKSSTKVSEVYIRDVAFQCHVLQSCGIRVKNAYVVHINNEYTRKGDLDLHKLFRTVKVTDEAFSMKDEIAQTIPDVFDLLRSSQEPVRDIGPHCSNPYECQFIGYCWNRIPENSIFNLQRNGRKFEQYNQGIITFPEMLASGLPMTAGQKMQIDAELNDTIYIDKHSISKFLDDLYYPLCFFDFETFQPPIPLFDNTRPYQQVPTQFSLHIIGHEGAATQHYEFLAREGEDPRETLIREMIRLIPANACVLAYNRSFEKSIILNLANDFPAYKRELMAIHDNIQDLITPFQKRHYYVKAMKGSHSIKYVLPALFPDDPDLSYDSLGLVHNGSEAMSAYLNLANMPEEDRLKTRQALLEYCRLDTLAMVKIWEKLREVSGG